MGRWQLLGDEKRFLVDCLWSDISVHQESSINFTSFLTPVLFAIRLRFSTKTYGFLIYLWNSYLLSINIAAELTAVIRGWWSFLSIMTQLATIAIDTFILNVRLSTVVTHLSRCPWTEIVLHTIPRSGINNPEASPCCQGAGWKAKIFQHTEFPIPLHFKVQQHLRAFMSPLKSYYLLLLN